MGDKLNGGILLPWFGSTCPHRVKGHYESLWSCLDWSVLCSDNTFLSWWEWFLLLLPRDNHPQGMRAHLKGLMRMKMIGYILVTRSQPNWTLMWDFVRPVLSSTIIKTPDGGISFGYEMLQYGSQPALGHVDNHIWVLGLLVKCNCLSK